MIQGSIPAIVTPMHADGSLDLPRLRKLVDWHIAEGSDGIVIVGTTGESPTVSFDEHCELIRTTVEQANKRVPVIAGTVRESRERLGGVPIALEQVEEIDLSTRTTRTEEIGVGVEDHVANAGPSLVGDGARAADRRDLHQGGGDVMERRRRCRQEHDEEDGERDGARHGYVARNTGTLADYARAARPVAS
jgi:hypothetical protein